MESINDEKNKIHIKSTMPILVNYRDRYYISIKMKNDTLD